MKTAIATALPEGVEGSIPIVAPNTDQPLRVVDDSVQSQWESFRQSWNSSTSQEQLNPYRLIAVYKSYIEQMMQTSSSHSQSSEVSAEELTSAIRIVKIEREGLHGEFYYGDNLNPRNSLIYHQQNTFNEMITAISKLDTNTHGNDFVNSTLLSALNNYSNSRQLAFVKYGSKHDEVHRLPFLSLTVLKGAILDKILSENFENKSIGLEVTKLLLAGLSEPKDLGTVNFINKFTPDAQQLIYSTAEELRISEQRSQGRVSGIINWATSTARWLFLE